MPAASGSRLPDLEEGAPRGPPEGSREQVGGAAEHGDDVDALLQRHKLMPAMQRFERSAILSALLEHKGALSKAGSAGWPCGAVRRVGGNVHTPNG